MTTTATSRVGPTAGGDLVDAGFEQRLIDGIRPIAEHFLAGALYHFFDAGVYDHLGQQGATPVGELAGTLGLDERRLAGLLRYLANEGVVSWRGDTVELTGRAHQYGEFRGWYTMFVGGYATTIQQIGSALRAGGEHCDRDGREVGVGSCEISRYDGMPMTRDLLRRAGVEPHEILDLGCGNALYLANFCTHLPQLRTAWGVEPDRGGYEEGRKLVAAAGMTDRITLVHRGASEFLADPPAGCDPDLIVLGYVLHEILAQEGEQAVVDLLTGVVARFPRINVVVIEVADEIRNPAVMRHGTARNFWNPYFLVHYFTNQRLESRAFWEALFARAGLTVAAATTTDPAVDSTGVELGYLLHGPEYR